MKTNTKEKIINEATKLFAKNGFDGTSMALIAEKVGIEKPSLYYFFADKNELFGEVLEKLWQNTAGVIKNNEELTGENFPSYLAEVLKTYLRAGLAVLKIDIPESKYSTGHSDARKQVIYLRSRLKHFLEKEAIPNVDAAEALVVHAIQGYVIQYQLQSIKVSPDEYASYISNVIFNTKKKS